MELFIGGMIAIAVGATLDVGMKDPMDRPLFGNMLIQTLSGFGVLIMLGCFVWGFFVFDWWVPIVALTTALIGGAFIAVTLKAFWIPVAYLSIPSGIVACIYGLYAA